MPQVVVPETWFVDFSIAPVLITIGPSMCVQIDCSETGSCTREDVMLPAVCDAAVVPAIEMSGVQLEGPFGSGGFPPNFTNFYMQKIWGGGFGMPDGLLMATIPVNGLALKPVTQSEDPLIIVCENLGFSLIVRVYLWSVRVQCSPYLPPPPTSTAFVLVTLNVTLEYVKPPFGDPDQIYVPAIGPSGYMQFQPQFKGFKIAPCQEGTKLNGTYSGNSTLGTFDPDCGQQIVGINATVYQ